MAMPTEGCELTGLVDSQQTATPSLASLCVFLSSVSVISLWGAQLDLT